MARRLGLMAVCTACFLLGCSALGDDRLGEDYTIGPGDVLQLQVFGEKELSGAARVAPSGRITLPQIGSVEVGGLTLSEAQSKITAALSDLIRRPRLLLTIDELQSERKVYVGGAVTTPGPYTLPFGTTVLDAVIAAGIRPDSDLTQVMLTRPGQTPSTLDISGWKTATGLTDLPLLRYGDAVFVPEESQRITVVGAVTNPVSLPPLAGERLTILDLVGRAAGGLSPEADPTTAVILHRTGNVTQVDLRKLFEEGDMSQNLTLLPGDVVVVRKAQHISVVGQVSNPTVFVSGEPVPVLMALARAGQVLPGADLARARVIGGQGARDIDLQSLIDKGERAEELKLYPGDILVVPEAAPQEVLLAGAVTRPGALDISKIKQRDLLRILTVIGLSENADGTRVCVLREGKQVVVNYRAILEDAALGLNVELEPGDVVFVPALDNVYVLGAVGQGGKVLPCPDEGLPLLEALIGAGGFGPESDLNQVHIVRPHSEGTTEHVQVKFGDIGRGYAPTDIVVKPGDIVYVGKRGKRFVWRNLVELIWTISAIQNILEE